MVQLTNILVSGLDAQTFLQGQLTCDVSHHQKQLGAYCTQQGRVISIFWIECQNDQFILTMPESIIQNTLDTLKKYAMFSKVELTVSDAFTETKEEQTHRFENNIPFIYPETIGKFTPHALSLEYKAISFTKGCFLGQEIIARTQHLGKSKQKLDKMKIDNPKIGATVYNEDQKPCGSIVEFNENTCMVVLKT